MKKILFYCQHLLGVGHLTRSLALCEALAGAYEVDLLQGGPEIGLALKREGFRRVKLPPLLMREDDSSLYDPSGDSSAEEIFAARRRVLAGVLEERSCDYLIIELFPFGRRKFRREILWLIAAARRANPGLRVHCSLRDVMIEREPEREAETVEWLKDFDSVLVHSDPRFFRLEESFAPAAEVPCPLIYTGFVAASGPAACAARQDAVLVSLGGGLVGAPLAEAAAEAAALLPAFEFRFALGPNTPEALRASLRRAARLSPNVRIIGFQKDFQAALRACRLSLSLAGYNTVMDLLRTRTRAIVFPYDANREQAMRARRFARAGLLSVAEPEDLEPARLAALIKRELKRPYPEVDIDLDGASWTRDCLLEAA